MNILYSGDRGIESGLIISVLSLMKHIREPLHVYVLTATFEYEGKVYRKVHDRTIETLHDKLHFTNPDNDITLVNISEVFMESLPVANMQTRFTPGCMIRLFADHIRPLPERLLYLDNDVVCLGDISEFYHQDMTGVEFAGVLDYYGSWLFRKHWRERDYINSGVLLMNMPEIQRTGLLPACRCRCAEKRMFMPDQTALNDLATRKRICDRRYNEQRTTQTDTRLRHFSTSFRFAPWFRPVSVKPWDKDRLYGILEEHSFDDILREAEKINQYLHI